MPTYSPKTVTNDEENSSIKQRVEIKLAKSTLTKVEANMRLIWGVFAS